jgi:lipopolysaccharide biosynthesis glycosyltransferase
MDINNFAVAMRYNGFPPQMWRENIGLSPTDKYFQAGVTVFNLDYWRRNDIASKVFDFVKNRTYLDRWDQDALCGALKGLIKPLPPKYNSDLSFRKQEAVNDNKNKYYLQFTINERHDGYYNPIIMHYTGFDDFKPWWADSKCPMFEKWRYYRKNGTPPFIAKKRLPFYYIRNYWATMPKYYFSKLIKKIAFGSLQEKASEAYSAIKKQIY